MGIGYWPTAVCGLQPRDIVKAIRHIVDTVGVDYVALGSDYDGAVTTGFDVTGLPHITQALLDDGFTAGDIQKIMGENALRLLRQALPATTLP